MQPPAQQTYTHARARPAFIASVVSRSSSDGIAATVSEFQHIHLRSHASESVESVESVRSVPQCYIASTGNAKGSSSGVGLDSQK